MVRLAAPRVRRGMTVARGGETWSFIRYFKELFQATQNLPPRQNLSFLSRGETPPAAQCESRMEPESAEVASRARDAARAAATASAEAATLEAAAEFERAALRASQGLHDATFGLCAVARGEQLWCRCEGSTIRERGREGGREG